MHTNHEEKRYVLDASVAVKCFCLEEGSSTARGLLKKGQIGKIRLFAPTLLLYEVGNALGRGKRLKKAEVVSALDLLMRSSIEFVDLSKRVVEHAAEFMEKYVLTFYDASYTALAYEWHCPLITADLRGHKKIQEIIVKDIVRFV